ncbi:hypothetical protein M9Y10_005793 [Tritrichomonas musculus]|uniref:Protein kinase domain-containing protein n=1 Tax=Tritrichomonas musculus TaxID=1915356 RepID=A0ABR2JD24_9EUKA
MCIDTLESFISPKKTIPDQYSLMAINRIFQAIEYLHSNNLVYHDIKPSNILLDNNSIPYISVLESIKTKDYFSTKNFELDIYSSPELFELGSVSSPSDLYSFGMKIYYILEKKHKKEEKDKITLLSNTFQNIFKDCINKSPLKRPDRDNIRLCIINELYLNS